MPLLVLVYFCVHAIFPVRSARPEETHHHLDEPTKFIHTLPSGQLVYAKAHPIHKQPMAPQENDGFGGAGFIEMASAGAVGGTGARTEAQIQQDMSQIRLSQPTDMETQLRALNSELQALHAHQDHEEEHDHMDGPQIAAPHGALSKLGGQYTAMRDAWEEATKKVFVGGDPAAENFIAKTGKDWMQASQKFKVTVGHMRAHAQRVYNNIVKSHVKAAKKQYHTFGQEIIKLKKVREEHKKIAAAAAEAEEHHDSGFIEEHQEIAAAAAKAEEHQDSGFIELEMRPGGEKEVEEERIHRAEDEARKIEGSRRRQEQAEIEPGSARTDRSAR